ncbi:MAG TPA: septum formation initiator family protein [Alphaproteobacteria bacterium]|nr:septum formation initiator family protein [Alphaproteobacteria bacterium]
MTLLDDIRRRARFAIVPVCCVSLVGYFVYHLIQGDRGLIALSRLSKDIKQLESEVTVAKTERTQIEGKTKLLRSNGIDADMLDERARAELGFSRPDEIVVFDKQ